MLEKIKYILNKNKEIGNKKKVENLVVFIIILIITIIIINTIWKEDDNKKEKANQNLTNKQLAESDSNYTYTENNSSSLEERLENILKSIEGVGNVNVFINYSETSSVIAMYNENTKQSSTEETDTSGGVRTIQETDTQKEVVYNEENGEKQPVTQKVINPKIEGAIISAQGASNTTIKTNIISAVEAVTGLATHKIQVFEMKN